MALAVIGHGSRRATPSPRDDCHAGPERCGEDDRRDRQTGRTGADDQPASDDGAVGIAELVFRVLSAVDTKAIHQPFAPFTESLERSFAKSI